MENRKKNVVQGLFRVKLNEEGGFAGVAKQVGAFLKPDFINHPLLPYLDVNLLSVFVTREFGIP